MSLSNGDRVYAVHMAKKVALQLKNLLEGSSRGDEIVASLKRINERLEQDPWNFGEQRFHLYELRLQMRVAVVSPISVIYAVHMDRPDVYIRGFVALEGA